MQRRWRLLLLLLIVMMGGVAYWAAPRAIMLAYGRYPNTVPQQMLAWVATPLPTALPAPEVTPVMVDVELLLGGDDAVDSKQLTVSSEQSTVSSEQSTVNSQQLTVNEELPPTLTPIPDPHSPTPTPLPLTPSPLPLPRAVHLQNISVIPQKFNNCGPANLSITMAFHGVEIDQLTIGSVVKPNYDDRNVSPDEMVDYVNQNTELTAVSFAGGNLTLLKTLLAAGYPVIIEKGLYPNEWEGWMGHYLTLIGYDDTTEEIRSLDTFLGPWEGDGRLDSYNTIDQFWQQFNYTFILVYPPADQPIINNIVGDLSDPEMMWRQAAFTAQQQMAAQPENPYAWFNLGSSLTELGHLTGEPHFYANAAAAFDQARTLGLPWRMLWYQFAPYEAYLEVGRYEDVLQLSDAILTSAGGQNVEETYLFRGYALEAMGDEAAAEAAFSRALALNPSVLE